MPLVGFIRICLAALFVLGLGIGEAGACSRENDTYIKTHSIICDRFSSEKIVGGVQAGKYQVIGDVLSAKYDDPQKQTAIQEMKKILSELDEYVYQMCEDTSWLTSMTPSNIAEYWEKQGGYKNNKWLSLQQQLCSYASVVVAKKKLSGKNCGHNNPLGCEEGQSCWRVVCSTTGGGTATGGYYSDVDKYYVCAPESGPGPEYAGCNSAKADENELKKEEHIQAHALTGEASIIHEDGSADYTHHGIWHTAPDLHVNADGIIDEIENFRSNKACNIEGQKEDYLGTCYSCTIVANLIRVFMNAAAATAPLTQEAGVKLLAIGMMLWFAFYVLKNLSSFSGADPMSMMQEIFTFSFKCLVAYVVITSGLLNIVQLIVNPLLIAGADYGIAMIDTVSEVSLDYTSVDQRTYTIGAGEIINQKVFDKIMAISKKADAAMSLNFVIGNAIMCHSTHAGAIVIAKDATDLIGFPPLYFPDIWLWICGALIYFFAFLVVMGINFYLLDLSFKIGFALLALPITIGLWPFDKFKDKFTECFKIIINAAGTFMFLGVTSAMSIVLISSALGGTDKLLEAIKADNDKYVSDKFAFASVSFFLILFAFLYSHKLISKTVSELTDKFFGAVTSGMTPMHGKTTQMIAAAKDLAMAGVGLATGGAGSVAAKAAKTAGKKIAKRVVKGVTGVARKAGRGSQE